MNSNKNALVEVTAAIGNVYAENAMAPASLNFIVDTVLRTPKGVASQATYLNGESPNGNAIMDRGDCAKEIRALAKAAGTPIGDDVTNAKLARIIMKRQRVNGLMVGRNGKLVLSYSKAE